MLPPGSGPRNPRITEWVAKFLPTLYDERSSMKKKVLLFLSVFTASIFIFIIVIIALIALFFFMSGKDNIEDPVIRSEREKKIGFVFPASTQWINSVYMSGMDDGWACKFTIPLGDVDTMFPPSEVTWKTDEKPFLFSGYKWLNTDHIKKYRAFEMRLDRIQGVRKRSTLKVLIDESDVSENTDDSHNVTVYLGWFEIN